MMAAAGLVGMSEAEFWDTTPRFLAARHEAFMSHHESLERANWERSRFLALFISAPHSRKKLSVYDLATFPWETQKTELDQQTMAEWKKELQSLWEEEYAANPELFTNP